MKKKEEHGSTLAEQVADGLLEHIRMKGLKTGDRLGTEMEMAEQLKVSRGTIREAIKILVSQNILEVRQGSCGPLRPLKYLCAWLPSLAPLPGVYI